MSVNGMESPAPSAEAERSTPLPGARAALILLLSINLFNYIDRQVLAAVEPKIRAELLDGDEHAMTKTGLLSTAFLVTYMLVSPIFGVFGDRYSRWKIIAVGVVIWSLASGLSGVPWPVHLAHAYLCLLITRCFVGVGEAAYGPVAPTIISDLYPVKVRGKVLAWFYAAIPVGSALGYTLGDAVVSMMGLSWRWAFYLVVPPGLLLGAWCLFMREPPRGQADALEKGETRKATFHDYKVLLRTPSYVLDTLGMTAMTFALGALAYWMPAYLEARAVANLGPLPPVMAFSVLTVLAGFAATLSGGMLGDLLRTRYSGSYFLVSGAGMLIGFVMLLGVLMAPFPMAWVFIFLAVFFLFFNTGPSNTILANVTHPAMRATAFAMNIFVLHALGDAISPPLVGFISDQAKHWQAARPAWLPEAAVGFMTEYNGMNAGFFVVSLMTLVGGIIWLRGARHLAEDTRRAPQQLDEPPLAV